MTDDLVQKKPSTGRVVIRALKRADGASFDGKGQFVTDYDPDAYEGRGLVQFTADVKKALTFDDAGAAYDFWNRASPSYPLRPDGQPNRPLTAYTISVEPLP